MIITTDTSDFQTLIQGGYVYVDKTAYLHRMISGVDGRFFFMSRPRRFGKSLMISTLEQIFKANRTLFKGLAIDSLNYDWKSYPVIRLDMTAFDQTSGLVSFKNQLTRYLGGGDNPVEAFRMLITRKAAESEGRGVAVLIDEYDSPISGLLGKPDELESMRNFLQIFYRIVKEESASVHFLMMTGVSKFTKLSVFSGLNNLTDLSMDSRYARLLGYTEQELRHIFKKQIADFAKTRKMTSNAVVTELLSWYDSYLFSPDSTERVCNPFSIGRALKDQRFYGYWNVTGNASLIIERLRKAKKGPLDMDGLAVRPDQLDTCDTESLPIEPLLYQGGYLTIDHVDSSGLLVLRVPNREVRQALDYGYVSSVLKDDANRFTNSAIRLMSELDAAEDPEPILNRVLTAVFAMVPHEWKLTSEAEAKRYFLLFMRMAGATINAEVESANGRADAILETSKTVYICEFKYGKSAKDALKQCYDRNYAAPYLADKRRIVYVGINYDTTAAAVEAWIGEVSQKSGEVRSESGEVNGEVKSYIAEHPGCRRKDIYGALQIAPRTLDRQVAKLVSLNVIEFRGAPKTGGYYPVDFAT